MGLPSIRLRRPLITAELPRVALLLASVFVFLYYHLIGPETIYFSALPATKQSKLESSNLSKLAYATLLLPSANEGSEENDIDVYFRSARLLNFQLQHSKYTRSAKGIPFIVLVTADIGKWKREKLVQEGATIMVVDKITSDWLQPMHIRWEDVMIKLRLWEFVQYNRILFLDADTFLLKPLDGVFDDPREQPEQTLQNADAIKPNESSLPQTYTFASHPEVLHTSHSYPPANHPNFNAGFMLLSPSLQMWDYLTSILSIPGRFDSSYPEQSLLNYAFRENGNIPWSRLDFKWGVELPNMRDISEGVHSIHSKLWTEGNELQPIEKGLRDKWEAARLEMENFYNVTERKH